MSNAIFEFFLGISGILGLLTPWKLIFSFFSLQFSFNLKVSCGLVQLFSR